MIEITLPSRFLRYVGPPTMLSDVEGMDECWPWYGGVWSRGRYGQYRDGKKKISAHKFAYQFVNGPVASGNNVDHRCRVTLCVNPSHLEEVTPKENQRRGLQVSLKTHCKNGHPWIPENIYIKPGSKKKCCRTCRRERRH